MKRALLTAILLLPLAACELSTEPGTLHLRVSASHAAPQAEESPSISYEIENSGTRRIYLASCDGAPLVDVERETSGGWVNVSASVCQANLDMVAIPLAPGERLVGHRPVTQAGRYRAVAYGSAQDGGAHVTVVSNPVTVAF